MANLNVSRSILAAFLLLLLSGCGRRFAPAPEQAGPDLVIFTYQPETVYGPIVKEYRERTGLSVRVLTGTYQDLQERIRSGTLAADCDVVFGIYSVTLEQAGDLWEPYQSPARTAIPAQFTAADGRWTGFSVHPAVIMYNTRVVTYRELPDGWGSLAEPRWKGRVAFMDPGLSDGSALATAMALADDPAAYVGALVANLGREAFASRADINLAIAEGRRFLGITLEEDAAGLQRQGADIAYVYPREGTCLLIDGSAIAAGCRHPDAGRAFIDFSISKDAGHFLAATLNRRSVREDIPPPPGLLPLAQLPPAPAGLNHSPKIEQSALAEWERWWRP